VSLSVSGAGGENRSSRRPQRHSARGSSTNIFQRGRREEPTRARGLHGPSRSRFRRGGRCECPTRVVAQSRSFSRLIDDRFQPPAVGIRAAAHGAVLRIASKSPRWSPGMAAVPSPFVEHDAEREQIGRGQRSSRELLG
jgi:hypothetical protein